MTKRTRSNAARPKGRQPCTFPECGKPVHAYGLCAGHNRQKGLGIELRPIRAPRPEAEDGFRWCSHCKLFHAEEDFAWDKTRGQYQRVCRDCNRESMRSYAADNREKVNNQRRLHRHRLTQDEYDAMVEAQAGACAICSRTDRKLDIDHCHSTGEVRGLLCAPCNRAIGFMNDDPDLFGLAIIYLDSHREETLARLRSAIAYLESHKQ